MTALCLAAVAAEPKIGTTIALRNGYGHEQYISNAFFKERPIAEELAKEGIDLCWYEGWGKGRSKSKDEGEQRNAVSSLKQFNAIWLITDHESQCPYTAQETAAALKAYVEAGGGLVVNHSIGRYAEAPVDAFWKEVMAAFGMEILHEQVADLVASRKEDKYYSMFFTDNFADHPVTKGLAGMWFAYPVYSQTWGPAAVRYSSDWTVLVATGPGGRSYPRNPITNAIEYDREGTYRSGNVPLVAARQFGKGRVVFSSIHKDNGGWMYKIDRWPNLMERSVLDGKPSDGLTLLANALKWAAEPSLSDKSFTADYRPVEPDKPPYYRQPDFGQRWLEKQKWTGSVPADRKPGAVGLIGLHSNHSDGESTVAEYVTEAKRLGLNFLVFTDPLAALTPEKLEKLRADCTANSSETFYCCPGVEYTDLSGLEWMTFTDKVSWPKEKPVLRDGRYYQIFDGKLMRQPRYYRGENLYRGALLNNKRIKEVGNFDVNLFWSNMVVPMAFDVDKVLFDNFPDFLEAGPNVRSTATVSYTRVRKASDLERAKNAAVTCINDLAAARKLTDAQGSGANRVANACHAWVKIGRGAEIRGFDVDRLQGTDLMRCAVRAASPAGLREVRVEDGSKRTLARFDAKGAKEFETVFFFEYDTQSYPQLIVTDQAGDRAVSAAKWVYSYHAGLHRCGDNANLLACNPPITMYVNRDLELCPPFKVLREPARHYHLSEAYFWESFGDWQRPGSVKSAIPSVMGEAINSLRLEGVDFPSEAKNVMPSSRTNFPLVMPNVVTIVDQLQGEWLVEPTRTEKNGTYGYCSMPPKVGENEYWRVRHRTYQLCDRIDNWWRAVYQENAPDYRGGYSVVEGEIEFLKDATIERPFTVLQVTAKNPKGPVARYASEGKFGPGSYYAAVPSDSDWFQIYGLKGCTDVELVERKVTDGLEVKLLAGHGGMKVRKGRKLRYRVALGRFNEPVHGGEYVSWFNSMMDGTGFMHDARKGRVVDVDGFAELEAENGETAVTFGPTWFIQRYPVRIRGLVDNGCACCTDGDKIVKPLAFCDGLAYAEIPLEKRKTWWFGNLYLSDNPALRLTYVPEMDGHEKAELQIHNPTDKEITAKVWSVRHFEVMNVRVPAGSSISKVVFPQKSARRLDNLRLDFHNRIRESGGHFDFVLLGDSITYNWRYEKAKGKKGDIPLGKAVAEREFKDYKWLNLGIGGDSVQGVTWRCQHGELDGYKTPLVNILIGTNNRGSSAEDVAEMIKGLVKVVREKHPESKILVNAILPRGPGEKDPCDLMAKNNRTNAILKEFCDGEKVVYVDWGKGLLKPDGTVNEDAYMFDEVHPGDIGYALWAKMLRGYLDEVK